MTTIALTGMMGCGKSSVSEELSRRTGWPCIDLDQRIEQEAGCSIPEIFAAESEAGFRKREARALAAILEQGREETGFRILSLGGGTLDAPGCLELVRDHTYCIYLRASVPTLTARLEHADAARRPMLSGADLSGRLTELLSRRGERYEKAARLTIDTDGKNLGEVIEEILKETKGKV